MGTPQAPGYGMDYPGLADAPGGVDTVKARLAEVLALCWEKIPETQFETLWKSMSDRVQAGKGMADKVPGPTGAGGGGT